MKNKKLYLFILGIFVLLGVATGGIIAWLTDTATTPSNTFTVGEVSYEWNEAGALVEGLVVPGQELVEEAYTLTNKSNVLSEIRVKVVITYKEGGLGSDLDGHEFVLLGLDELWIESQVTGEDHTYYFTPGEVDDHDTWVPDKDTFGDAFNVLTSLILDGSKVGNSMSGDIFTVTLTFEAKQAEFVTWEALGTASINFSTGLAD